MSRRELAAVRGHGTVLLFVVWLASDGSYLSVPKYSLLSPFAVDALVEASPPRRKSINVPLKDLPRETDALEALVGLALQTRKQSVLVGSGSTLLQNAKTIWVRGLREITFDEPLIVSPVAGEFVIEVETEDGAVLPLPGVLEILPSSYVDHEMELAVACGEIQYERPTVRQISGHEHVLKLSNSLEMTLRFDGNRLQSSSVNLSLADNLATRVKDVDFTLALARQRSLAFNGQAVDFDFSLDEPPSDLVALRERLGKLLDLLDRLHVDPALISMDAVTPEQERRLTYLHASLVDGIELRADEARATRVYEEIGTKRLSLMVMPGEGLNQWKYVDPFDPANRGTFKLYSTNAEGDVVEVDATVYDATEKDEFLSVLNLNLGSIVDAYQAVADAPGVAYLANQALLKLIHAADADADRRHEFLSAAAAMCDWLDEVDTGSVPNVLNRYQIRARAGGLSATDKAEIRSLRRDILRRTDEYGSIWEAGCAILLGDEDDVVDCVANLPRSQLTDLMTYPIWALVPEVARQQNEVV